ncbi:MAG: hypothetical protein J6Y33_03120 [Prevotella sp.]|nr:hypothetical protein [Prevotella sp.]
MQHLFVKFSERTKQERRRHRHRHRNTGTAAAFSFSVFFTSERRRRSCVLRSFGGIGGGGIFAAAAPPPHPPRRLSEARGQSYEYQSFTKKFGRWLFRICLNKQNNNWQNALRTLCQLNYFRYVEKDGK